MFILLSVKRYEADFPSTGQAALLSGLVPRRTPYRESLRCQYCSWRVITAEETSTLVLPGFISPCISWQSSPLKGCIPLGTAWLGLAWPTFFQDQAIRFISFTAYYNSMYFNFKISSSLFTLSTQINPVDKLPSVIIAENITDWSLESPSRSLQLP